WRRISNEPRRFSPSPGSPGEGTSENHHARENRSLCARFVRRLSCSCSNQARQRTFDPDCSRLRPWDKDIAAFEKSDRENPPPKGEILFVGSSTIVRWKTLADDFPKHRVINRGFGGSEIADSAHFADRIVIPHAPRMVLLCAGTNDIHAGRSPEAVFADF